MDSDSDSSYEENSEAEKGIAGPLNIKVNVNLEGSPEWPPPVSPSPVLPQPIPLGEMSPVWELPDNGTFYLSYYTRADILELKNGAQVTRDCIKEEGYVVEEPWYHKTFWRYCSNIMALNGK